MALGRVHGFHASVLRELLDERGLSVDAVAVRVGVTPQAVRGWMRGSYKPTPEAVRALGDLCEVDPLVFSGKTLLTAGLLDLRQRLGLTAADAAERAGLIRSQVSSLEQAVINPKLDQLDALAEPYGVTVEEVRRAWVNRRIERFGRESLLRLPSELLAELGES